MSKKTIFSNRIILYLFSVILLNCFSAKSYSQEIQENYKFTYFGINFSPIIPGNLLQKNEQLIIKDSVSLKIKQNPGYVFGMEVKHDFTRFLALQTGISFVQRKYKVEGTFADSINSIELKFIGYELPVLAQGFVRLTKNIYADLSLGFCVNFYPSDLAVPHFYSRRLRWAQLSLLGNLGIEYRSNDYGIFYLGCLYQRHDKNMLTIFYYNDAIYGKPDLYGSVTGNYLAVNLKYFFPQNPEKSKRKEK